MRKGKDTGKQYTQNVRQTIAYHAAANAWASGVPWAQALEFSEKALEKASPRPKAKARQNAKAKAKPKAKPKARQ